MNDVAATGADADAPKSPWRRYPFAYAAVFGVVILTVLPFFQRAMLRAPPPLASMGDWELTDRNSTPLSDDSLRGRVFLVVPFCTTCSPITKSIERILRHTEGDGIDIVMVTVKPSEDSPLMLQEVTPKSTRLYVATGTPAQVETLIVERMRLPMAAASTDSRALSVGLVDQNGELRGFWPANDEGVGNVINAARLLAKHGPMP